jgi:beta-glucosidase
MNDTAVLYYRVKNGQIQLVMVQLYIRDVLASARPVMELKGFQRVSLKAGEKNYVYDTPDELKMYNEKWNGSLKGDFSLMIGLPRKK